MDHTRAVTLKREISALYMGKVRITKQAFQQGNVDCPGSEIKLLTGVEKAIGSMQTNEVAQVTIKGKYVTGKFSNQEVVPDDAEIVYEIRLNKFTKVS